MTMLTVDDLARDLKVKNEDLVRELVILGFPVEGPESPLETDDPAALRAQLSNVFPQREVVEKRIKPTVIRRRAKHNEQAGAKDQSIEEEPTEMRVASEESQSKSEQDRAQTDSLQRRPQKKIRKPEPARIIEMAPRPEPKPEPDLKSLSDEVKPESSETAAAQETKQDVAAESISETRTEPQTPPIKTEKFERARIIAPAEPVKRKSEEHRPSTQTPSRSDSRPEAARVIGQVQRPDSRSERTTEFRREQPGSRPDSQRPDDRSMDPRKKKKKDRRVQPAQIIGKVELHRPAPKAEIIERAPAQQTPSAPARHTQSAPPQRQAERRPLAPPPFAPQTFVPDFVSDDEKRKKAAKKKERKTKDGVEEKVEEGKVNRRKEVIMKSDLLDDRNRPMRLRGKAKKPKPRKTELTTPKAIKRRIKVPEIVTVSNLAHKLSVKATQVIQHLLSLGVTATMNETIDFDTAVLLGSEFGYEVEHAEQSEISLLPTQIIDTTENLLSRSPVVTVMGHVDHGKTSLLDAIRSTHVTDQEAGGITQHIGAYKVRLPRGELVFLDTPGHEAFTAMRARGAQVTDFVVLVVAADDGVMDQTVEAINHAKAAQVPIIVAVNKIDKPEADKDRVLRELSEHGLIPETWGGDTLFSYVSAKTREGVEELLDLILLQAEMMELQANPNKQASGTIVEARLDKGKGPVATVLVKEGTLKLGDAFVAGFQNGKVRAMLDDEGKQVEIAGPATPVEVQGFSGVPEAGDIFLVVEDEKVARQIVDHRLQKQREHDLTAAAPVSLENLLARMTEEPIKELNLIVKADVQGSVEALKEALTGISAQEIKVKVIHSGVGAITESDVMLARASNAIIIGFNVRPTPKTAALAEQEKIDVRLYNIIYEALDDIRKAMEGMLSPIEKETVNGRAEVRQTFSVPKIGAIGGCYIISGKIERSNQVRLIRDNVVIYTGKISSMKRFKEDVREAVEGYECGIGLENYKDIKIGDIIEAFIIEQESAKLT